MVELSLKGRDGRWPGVSDSSGLAPSPFGRFKTLEGCYVTRDGTELRRRPGFVVSHMPLYLDRTIGGGFNGFTVSGITTGTKTRLTLSPAHQLPSGSGLAWLIGVPGVTNGYYTFTRVDATNIDVDVTTSGAPTAAGSVYLARVDATFEPHGMKTVARRLAIVGQTRTSDSAGSATYEHVATWTDALNPSTTLGSPRIGMWQYPSGVNQDYAGFGASIYATMANQGRSVIDVFKDSLIIATPGHGYMLTAQIAAEDLDRVEDAWATVALGVPQCVVDDQNFSWTGTGANFQANAKYWIAVAFQNRFTGELGLASEPFQSPTTGATGPTSADIPIYRPRDLLFETANLNAVIFMSAANASGPGAMYPVKVVRLDNTASASPRTTITVQTTNENPIPVGIDTDRRFPNRLERMPGGASWVKTVRGLLVYGGGMSRTGLAREDILVDSVGTGPNLGQFQARTTSPVDGKLSARYDLPDGFAGGEIFLEAQGTGKWARYRIGRKVTSGLGVNLDPNVWEFDGHFDAAVTGRGAKVVMPAGHMRFSLLDHAGISPANNRVVIDRIEGGDIIAAARFGDGLLLMTTRETYMMRWRRSPLGEDPVIVSRQYGCVAPNSVVEGDGWAAWISAQGPVMFAGAGVEWIGAAIQDRWRDIYRSTQGMARHIQATHDLENRLILWSVVSEHRSSYYSGKADEACDEILAFQYETRAFSFWPLQGDRRILDVERVLHADGKWRVAVIDQDVDAGSNLCQNGEVVGEFMHVYSATEHGSEFRHTPVLSATLQGPQIDAAGTWFVGMGSWADVANRPTGAQGGVRVGEYAVISDVTTGNLLWHGTIEEVDITGTNHRVRLSNPPSSTAWKSGDIIEIGIIPIVIETNFERFGRADQKSALRAVTIRHENTYTSTIRSWMDVVVTDETGGSVRFQPRRTENPDAIGINISSGRLHRLEGAVPIGNEHQIKITVLSNSAERIKDIILDVEIQA